MTDRKGSLHFNTGVEKEIMNNVRKSGAIWCPREAEDSKAEKSEMRRGWERADEGRSNPLKMPIREDLQRPKDSLEFL